MYIQSNSSTFFGCSIFTKKTVTFKFVWWTIHMQPSFSKTKDRKFKVQKSKIVTNGITFFVKASYIQMKGREVALVNILIYFVKLITKEIVRRVILCVGITICIRINVRITTKLDVINEID